MSASSSSYSGMLKNEELPNRHQESRWRVKRGCHKKKQEEAIGQEHPMITLIDSSNKQYQSKLMQLISNGSLKKVLTSYFVAGQKMKLSDKFLETVDGCKGVTRQLILNCLDHHIPDLSRIKVDMSAKQPLRRTTAHAHNRSFFNYSRNLRCFEMKIVVTNHYFTLHANNLSLCELKHFHHLGPHCPAHQSPSAIPSTTP